MATDVGKGHVGDDTAAAAVDRTELTDRLGADGHIKRVRVQQRRGEVIGAVGRQRERVAAVVEQDHRCATAQAGQGAADQIARQGFHGRVDRRGKRTQIGRRGHRGQHGTRRRRCGCAGIAAQLGRCLDF